MLEFQKNIPRHVTESTSHIETSKGVGKSVDAHDTKDNSTEKAEVVDGSSRAQKTEDATPSVESDTNEVTTKVTGPSEHVSSVLSGIDQSAAHSADLVHPHKDTEARVNPGPGEAVAAASDSEEARLTHEEMSNITSMKCPFLMNRE